jgi:hypothetical protein
MMVQYVGVSSVMSEGHNAQEHDMSFMKIRNWTILISDSHNGL